MSREDPQMKIRLPADLKDTVENAAKVAGRSMNAEIVARLQASFDSNRLDQDSLSTPATQLPPDLLQQLERLFDEKLGGVHAVIDTGHGLEQVKLVSHSKIQPKSSK